MDRCIDSTHYPEGSRELEKLGWGEFQEEYWMQGRPGLGRAVLSRGLWKSGRVLGGRGPWEQDKAIVSEGGASFRG